MLKLPQRIWAEPSQMTFGAYWVKNIYGESSFGAGHEVIASACKTQAF